MLTTTDKNPGTIWKYLGNEVRIISWNGCLVYVQVVDEIGLTRPFLVAPHELVAIGE